MMKKIVFDNSKTYTKKDCDELIKTFNDMIRGANDAINSLKNTVDSFEDAKKIVSDMRKRFDVKVNEHDIRTFEKCIGNYATLHNLTCKIEYPYAPDDRSISEITFYDENGRLITYRDPDTYYESTKTIVINWTDVYDIKDTLDYTLDYIKREIL